MRHICAIIFILFILLGLLGCSEQKQAAKKTSWLLAHDLMDDECARLYPNVDSTVKGDTVTNFDTLYLDNDVYIRDTVIKNGKTIYIEKKCPPNQTITVTKFLHDSIYRSNTAEVERWRSIAAQKDRQIKEKDDLIIKQQKNIDVNDKWKLWFFCLLGLNIIGFIIRFFVIKKPL